jgi:hypothetical protein
VQNFIQKNIKKFGEKMYNNENNAQKQFNRLGYDTFIGRTIFPDGREFFVTLDLHRGGSGSYTTIKQACGDLIYEVKEGKKVSLYHNPGKIGPITRNTGDVSNNLESLLKKLGAENLKTIENTEEQTYTLSERTYEPFKPEQMAELKKMYDSEPEMKKYPSPFSNQITLN